MAVIEERVKEFLETWQRRKAREIPSSGPASCKDCGVVLEDGNFVLVEGDLVCLDYIREQTKEVRCLPSHSSA